MRTAAASPGGSGGRAPSGQGRGLAAAAATGRCRRRGRRREQAAPPARRRPDRLLRRPVRPAQLVQVVKADDYNADPGNDREIVRDFTRPRGAILTADGVVLAESVPSNDRFKLPARVPDGRPVRRRHRLLLVPLRHRRRRAAVQRRARRPHATAEAAGLCQPLQRRGQHRRRAAHAAQRHPDSRQGGARRPGGLGRRARPAHRRHPGDVELPELRPEPPRHPRLRRRQGGRDALLRRPGASRSS